MTAQATTAQTVGQTAKGAGQAPAPTPQPQPQQPVFRDYASI